MNDKEKREKIQKMAERIAYQFHPEKIILFGSYAWGAPNENSDADLLIIKNSTDARATARELDGAIFPRPFPIDIIVLSSDKLNARLKGGDPFLSDILQRGKLLYAR